MARRLRLRASRALPGAPRSSGFNAKRLEASRPQDWQGLSSSTCGHGDENPLPRTLNKTYRPTGLDVLGSSSLSCIMVVERPENNGLRLLQNVVSRADYSRLFTAISWVPRNSIHVGDWRRLSFQPHGETCGNAREICGPTRR